MSRFVLAAALLVSFAASVQAAAPASSKMSRDYILCGRWQACVVHTGIRL
jgi:opacity protein-like surface antigen